MKPDQDQLPILMPAPGARVRKLDGTVLADDGEALAHLAADGESLTLHPYYARLLADGDLIAAAEAAASGSTQA